jgi:hypothetical protein
MDKNEYFRKYAPEEDSEVTTEGTGRDVGEFNSPREFMFQGTPGPKNCIRFITAQEAVKLCEDPKIRECLDIIQKDSAKNFPHLFAEKPLGVKKVVQHQCVHNAMTAVHVAVNKKVIDSSLKKRGMR